MLAVAATTEATAAMEAISVVMIKRRVSRCSCAFLFAISASQFIISICDRCLSCGLDGINARIFFLPSSPFYHR